MAREMRPLFLAGPTATGKSEIALFLAERLDAEIISVDSMQVYQGLDVGTAKPSPQERRRVPHHLLDVVPLTRTFSAAEFIVLAQAAEREIRRRGRVPLFCGGTGLYFKAYLYGLGCAPAADLELRRALDQAPLSALLEELRQQDPIAFERVDRQNRRRVTRAVEVIRLTGRPFSEQRAAWIAAGRGAGQDPGAAPFFALERTRPDRNRRIEDRVDQMFQKGLVEETRELLKQGLAENLTARQALGYRQILEHLDGKASLPATIERVKQMTRQFAKRQTTWFKVQPGVEWIALGEDESPEQVARRLAEKYLQPPRDSDG